MFSVFLIMTVISIVTFGMIIVVMLLAIPFFVAIMPTLMFVIMPMPVMGLMKLAGRVPFMLFTGGKPQRKSEGESGAEDLAMHGGP